MSATKGVRKDVICTLIWDNLKFEAGYLFVYKVETKNVPTYISPFCFHPQKVKLNPGEVIQKEDPINRFVDYLDQFLVPQSIQQILPPSDVVGNIRFSHPTLYVFPGGINFHL